MNDGNRGDKPLGPFGKLLMQLLNDDAVLAEWHADPERVKAQFEGVSEAQIALLGTGDAGAIEAEFVRENLFTFGDPTDHVRQFANKLRRLRRRGN